jgi:hypothetical protein
MKNRIKLDMEAFETQKKPGRPTYTSIAERDKIAKLYALAEKLHVKIGGDTHDRP